MNFTIKYHKPAQACMCVTGIPYKISTSNPAFGGIVCPTVSFKDVDGNDYTQLVNGYNGTYGGQTTFETTAKNHATFNALTAYASSEKIANFNDADYSVSSVGTASVSYSYGASSCTYVVLVSNSGNEDIKVNSLKFVKPLYPIDSVAKNCLMYSCYLDEEVTIPAGQQKDFVVVFNFLNP